MMLRRIPAIALGAVLIACLTVPAGAQQRVSIYTAHTANIVERLIPEFEKTTGIKADVVKAGSGDIINRVRAESVGKSQPEQLGFSPKVLGELTEFFKGEVAAGRIPGVVMLVQRHGKPAYFETFGVRDVAIGNGKARQVRRGLARRRTATGDNAIAVERHHGVGHRATGDPPRQPCGVGVA